MKLTQKHLLKGSQEFEIVDDYISVRIKPHFKEEETLTVMLTVLNPEPVITKSCLNFTSRVNGEPLLSLYLGKPNAEQFNAFIAAVKERAKEEYQAFAGLRPANQTEGLGDNTYDEPPQFDDPDTARSAHPRKKLDPQRIGESIQMLQTHLDCDEIRPVLTALEALQSDPDNETLQVDVVNSFNGLGPTQGAVLTYAPYVGILMSDGPAGSPY